jgi:hypothetical protein
MSLIESIVSILVGFGISLGAQIFFLPLLGVTISLTQNFLFAVIMTAISICRQYVMRRIFEALHIRNPLSAGALAIVAERRRQIEQEGRTIADDLNHNQRGELARAGAAYLLLAGDRPTQAQNAWPWHRDDLKAKEFRKNIVRGCALGLAELDRQDAERKRRD